MTTARKPAGPAAIGTGRALIPPHPWSLTVTEPAATPREAIQYWYDAATERREERDRLRAVVARLSQMADYWEQQLPEVIRTPAVVSAIRAALEPAATPVPPPADRAAALQEAAARMRKIPVDCTALTGPVWYGQGWKDAISELEEIADSVRCEDELRRLAAEAQPTTRPDTATLAAALDGLHTLIATSSRDWGQYAPDAWLYAVVLGWDCEETEHDETCTHGAMEEMQQRHGWSDEAVAKARRYRAAVRALTEPAAGARQDGAQSP